MGLKAERLVDLVAQAGAGLQEEAIAAVVAKLNLGQHRAAPNPAFAKWHICGRVKTDKVRARAIIDQQVNSYSAVDPSLLVFEKLILRFKLNQVEIKSASVCVCALHHSAQAQIIGDALLIVQAGGNPVRATIRGRGERGAKFYRTAAGCHLWTKHTADILGECGGRTEGGKTYKDQKSHLGGPCLASGYWLDDKYRLNLSFQDRNLARLAIDLHSIGLCLCR